ncbi:hypothetical protein [Pseudonocardia xishanensis]|uniref:hypothetical protein n=1 Tax=Pseudonocardia xishanensis TaxID=630995 RepID=UPI0031EC13CE
MTALVDPAARYAEALSARRSELGSELRALDGWRAALRAELALVAVGSRGEVAAALRRQRDRCGPWIGRAALPAALAPALERMRVRLIGSALAEAAAAVCRVAGGVCGPEPLPAELVSDAAHRDHRVVGALPRPPRPVGWVEAVVRSGGGGAVRVALVLAAGAPALGLTVAGGRMLLPLAVGMALVAVAVLARHRRAAVERERWARWVDAVLDATAAAVRAELDTALITLEQRSARLLADAAAARRAAITTELRALGGLDAP